MAIDNPNCVDGIGIDREQNDVLRLLITDHFAWQGEDTLDEYDHLMMLQDKINAYISYLESGQYKQTYPDREFSMAILEIHFMYEISDNCTAFLNAVQSQIEELGILIEAHIG